MSAVFCRLLLVVNKLNPISVSMFGNYFKVFVMYLVQIGVIFTLNDAKCAKNSRLFDRPPCIF